MVNGTAGCKIVWESEWRVCGRAGSICVCEWETIIFHRTVGDWQTRLPYYCWILSQTGRSHLEGERLWSEAQLCFQPGRLGYVPEPYSHNAQGSATSDVNPWTPRLYPPWPQVLKKFVQGEDKVADEYMARSFTFSQSR